MIDKDGILVVWMQGTRIQICLPELIRTTGLVEVYTDPDNRMRYRTTITKKNEARRILKLVTPYLRPEAVAWMDEHFPENQMLNGIWLKLRGEAGSAL